MTIFRIRITLCLSQEARYHRMAYVAKRDGDGTSDGSWYTEHEPDQIKTWKTRRGAEKWLQERPSVRDMNAEIEVVTEYLVSGSTSRQRLTLVSKSIGTTFRYSDAATQIVTGETNTVVTWATEQNLRLLPLAV